jgi:hypothetical protein
LVVCALLASGLLAASCGVGLPAQLLAGCSVTCVCCLLTADVLAGVSILHALSGGLLGLLLLRTS